MLSRYTEVCSDRRVALGLSIVAINAWHVLMCSP